MPSYLRYIITLIIMFYTGFSLAGEKNAADLSFLVTPPIVDITNGACVFPVLFTYTIIAGTPVPLTLQDIRIKNDDSLGENAVTIASSSTCKINQKLAMDETCNIVVSFQPCETGVINRDLIIDINTSQGSLISSISTEVTVKNFLQVAAGHGANNSPLVVDSQDNGVTWKIINDTVPSPSNVSYNAAACNLANTCIIAGQDNTNVSGANPPLLITTLDNGNQWNRVTQVFDNNTPVNFPTTGRIEGASCSGNNCIAVGIALSNNDAPLLYNSQDSGATWYQRSITNGPTQAELFGGSCNGNKCIVTGAAVTGNPPLPLLAQSIDGGITWNPITTLGNNNTPFPVGTRFSARNPSCSNTICLAGGSIMGTDPSIPTPPITFLISSINTGNWNNVTVPNGLPSDGSFNSFSCSGSNCVAVGGASSTNQTYVVNTVDGGQSWNQITKLSNGSDVPTGGLDHVSCYNNNCVAGTEGTNTPLLLSSNDGGVNWQQITTASGNPGFPNYGGFTAIGCSNNICMAVGGNITDPTYLLASIDGGKTWSNVQTSGGTLPSGGIFNTVSISR